MKEDFELWDPPKSMSKEPFLKKNERITNVLELRSAKHVAIRYQRGQKYKLRLCSHK